MTVKERYEAAREMYKAMGVDTDKALEALKRIPVSMHCWQGDDVVGFDGAGALSGGIQTTGDYPGRARTPEELMADMDKALEELIGYYSQREEPTLVVFFGDHQPPLANAFYEKLYGKKLSERTTEEVMEQYAVPFFIWANYDIPEMRDVVVSPNYLGAITAKAAGLPTTGYMEFLLELYEVLPAVTPVGFVTSDGQFRSKSELDEVQRDWLWKYEVLNYCGMVDLFDEARPMFILEEEGGQGD